MSSFDPFLELRQQIARRTANTCAHHQPFDRACQTPLEAIQWADLIKQCTKDAQWNHLRWLALNDLYFLIVHILEIPNVNTQWHVDYIGEINRNYDNIIDLATRGSGKSVMKTYGKLLQEILKDPDSTHCIFSHTKPIAKDFLFKIKSTFENHEKLRWLFPDVIWENPERDAPKWSLDRGITVKRKNVTRGEATIECSGMVDGQPTGKHYDWIWYDDIQKEQVSEYMIEQIEQSFDTSLGLSAGKPAKWTMTGVFFRGGSIYEQLLERKVGLARIRPAVNKDCTSPIWTDEHCRATMRSLKPGNWACEYLMDPTMKEANEGFQKEWLRYHKGLSAEDLNSCNLYIVVDPGKGRENKTQSGKTSIQVIALHPDKRRYLLDGIKAGMNLEQRTEWLFRFHRQYNDNGRVQKVGYEHYGLQADVEHIRLEQQREGYLFDIVPLSAHVEKDDRIQWLIPAYKNAEMILPSYVPKRMINGEEVDFLQDFLSEYDKFPATKVKDALDCQAWIMYRKPNEPNVWTPDFPEGYADPSTLRKHIDFDEADPRGGTWMTN